MSITYATAVSSFPAAAAAPPGTISVSDDAAQNSWLDLGDGLAASDKAGHGISFDRAGGSGAGPADPPLWHQPALARIDSASVTNFSAASRGVIRPNSTSVADRHERVADLSGACRLEEVRRRGPPPAVPRT